MNLMKRHLVAALFLGLFSIIGFAGCGEGGGDTTKPADTTTTKPADGGADATKPATP
jgi:hypothetical protein